MIVINSLIAVEVPRGAAEHQLRSEYGANFVVYKNHEAYHYVQLPFPGEIIGLASEIDAWKIIDAFVAAQFESATTNLSSGLQTLLAAHSLTTTPTTDIIFLRRKL